MTAHMNTRTATDRRPSTVKRPASTSPTTASPKRPLPRWVAPVGVVAAICVAGVGILVYDATSELAPVPTRIEESTVAAPTVRVGQVAQPGRPDGGVAQPVTAGAFEQSSVGTGQIAQSGLPDGYWQPTTLDARADNPGCRISGPC
jgi:hypothetical protein